MKRGFENLRRQLRKAAGDPAVIGLTGREPDRLTVSAHRAYVTLTDSGISVVLIEAPWLFPPKDISDPKALHISAFHLHRKGHEGLPEYQGQLPKGVQFGDTKEEIIRKLGPPLTSGGGGYSDLLKKPIPHWLRYPIEDAFLQFQLDATDKLEMATLYVPDYEWIKP